MWLLSASWQLVNWDRFSVSAKSSNLKSSRGKGRSLAKDSSSSSLILKNIESKGASVGEILPESAPAVMTPDVLLQVLRQISCGARWGTRSMDTGTVQKDSGLLSAPAAMTLDVLLALLVLLLQRSCASGWGANPADTGAAEIGRGLLWLLAHPSSCNSQLTGATGQLRMNSWMAQLSLCLLLSKSCSICSNAVLAFFIQVRSASLSGGCFLFRKAFGLLLTVNGVEKTVEWPCRNWSLKRLPQCVLLDFVTRKRYNLVKNPACTDFSGWGGEVLEGSSSSSRISNRVSTFEPFDGEKPGIGLPQS